jgi:hypothetical protein
MYVPLLMQFEIMTLLKQKYILFLLLLIKHVIVSTVDKIVRTQRNNLETKIVLFWFKTEYTKLRGNGKCACPCLESA